MLEPVLTMVKKNIKTWDVVIHQHIRSTASKRPSVFGSNTFEAPIDLLCIQSLQVVVVALNSIMLDRQVGLIKSLYMKNLVILVIFNVNKNFLIWINH